MEVYQIKANKALFDAWQTIGYRIAALSNIVQNDMELTRDDLLEWRDDLVRIEADLDKLTLRTAEHITGTIGK
jgi:hypothetical protein